MSTKSSKKTGKEVAKSNQFDMTNMSKSDVPKMLEQVGKKLEELKGNAPEKVGTDVILPGFDKKIKNIDTVEELVKAHSSVTGKANAYKTSAEALEVSTKKYPFKLNGHTEEEWVDDIRFRTAEVKNKKDIQRLEEIETTLSKYISEEDKMKKDLAKIGSLLMDE